MPVWKLTLEYDGTAYAGWQRQPNQPTVQGAVETAITHIVHSQTPVAAAGRTDAGVHALGQVASFQSDAAMEAWEWVRSLNGVLHHDISVQSADPMPDTFHARFSAVGKLYEYRIYHRRQRQALERGRSWHVHQSLDKEAMHTAATTLLGTHDFSSFEGALTDNTNPVCTLHRVDLIEEGPLLRLQFQGDRFLKQMVRALVGTLVEVGLGKRQPSDLTQIIDAHDRRAAGYTAPPYGLYLVRVDY